MQSATAIAVRAISAPLSTVSSRCQGLCSSSDAVTYIVHPTLAKFGEQTFSVAGRTAWYSTVQHLSHFRDFCF